MHCVVLTIAESRRMDCQTSTNLYGPFDSAEAAEEQVNYLRGAYGQRILYVRSFCLAGAAPPPGARPFSTRPFGGAIIRHFGESRGFGKANV